MSTPKPILLRNTTALIHDSVDNVVPTRTDILLENGRIERIEPDIKPADGWRVMDCTGKIVSPGFVDTHHHVWQTQLKGRHADHSFINYMPSGNFISAAFTAEDVFWGQMGGCLEMLHAGTTTVADFAHMNMSPEHNFAAVSATVASGIRSVFGFSPNPIASSLAPFTIDPNGLAGHSMSTFEALAKASPWAGGRVKLGLAWDGFPFTPKEYVDMLMEKVNAYGIDLIQTHISWKPGKPSAPQAIERLGVLDARFLMAHSNMSREDAELYRRRGVHYSSTPSTELQMALAFPVVAFREDLGVRDLGSLGVDCHAAVAAFIPGEARLGLQSARAHRGEIAEKEGKMPLTVGPTVLQAFNLATINGARAMKMGDQIGSIAVGKAADLVIFDGNTPAMICAGVHDPVTAVILHSSPADVESVIVDGIVRKQDGKLTEVTLDEQGKKIASVEAVGWSDVARNLVRTRERIQAEAEKVDYADAEGKVKQAFYLTDDDFWSP